LPIRLSDESVLVKGKPWQKTQVGLALGGGGARGLAHIGVLEVLAREQIPFHLIAGSGMGAVVGAAFALFGEIEPVIKIARGIPDRIPQLEELQNVNQIPRQQKHAVSRIVNYIKELYVLNLEATKKGLVNNEDIYPVLEDVFGDKTFSDLKFPFAAVATDLQTGEEMIIREGLLTRGVLASMAIPGIFEPVEWNGKILVDGSVTSLVPIEACKKLDADLVFAVSAESNTFKRKFERGIDALFQVDEIRGAELNRLKLQQADFVIRPNIGHVSWSQFAKVNESIHRGEQAAIISLSGMRELLVKHERKGILKCLWPFR